MSFCLQAGGFHSVPGEGRCDLRQTHLGLGQRGGRGHWTAGTSRVDGDIRVVCLDVVVVCLDVVAS